jgi:hypothetical protein
MKKTKINKKNLQKIEDAFQDFKLCPECKKRFESFVLLVREEISKFNLPEYLPEYIEGELISHLITECRFLERYNTYAALDRSLLRKRRQNDFFQKT